MAIRAAVALWSRARQPLPNRCRLLYPRLVQAAGTGKSRRSSATRGNLLASNFLRKHDLSAPEFLPRARPCRLSNTLFSCISDRAVGLGGDNSSVGTDASYRQVVDLSALERGESQFVAPMGQDGNPFSAWYDNTLGLWQTGDMWRMATTGYTVARAQRLYAGSP